MGVDFMQSWEQEALYKTDGIYIWHFNILVSQISQFGMRVAAHALSSSL